MWLRRNPWPSANACFKESFYWGQSNVVGPKDINNCGVVESSVHCYCLPCMKTMTSYPASPEILAFGQSVF